MENIKMYEEFDINEDDMITIPRSVIEDWIQYLTDENEEVVIVQVYQVQEEMKKFLDDYYSDNKIDAADPEEIAKKHAEDIEPVEELSSDDENPNFIKKFEGE
jgi:tetrahydromethanopterin S-methyltransferase subunit B